MKHIVEFNLPDDREELKDYMRLGYLVRFHDDLYNEVFRPEMKYNGNEHFEKVWERIIKFIEDIE